MFLPCFPCSFLFFKLTLQRNDLAGGGKPFVEKKIKADE